MGIGILEILGLIFIILKLFGIIAWSWWWVCSPLLLGLAIGFIVGMIAMGTGISQGKSREEILRDIMRF